MVTNEATGLGRGRLPAVRRELAQVVLVGHAGQPGQEVAQVGERVFAVALAGDDQRVEDGRALAGVGMPDKQPVLFADAGRPQGGTSQGGSGFAVCRDSGRWTRWGGSGVAEPHRHDKRQSLVS
jgi:hypothetical protein